MATRDYDDIVAVTVFCDECGDTRTGDYKVPAGADSLMVARRWLEEHAGWVINDSGDYCNECAPHLGKPVHVYPTGDHIEHVISETEDCPCGPRTEAIKRNDGSVGWLHVHHSLDGRELKEQADERERIHWENFATVRNAKWCRCQEDSMPHIWLPSTAWGASDHDRVPPSLRWELDQFQDDARFAGIIPRAGKPNHDGMWTPDVKAPNWLV
jgi:hypothetical protein